MRNAPVYPDPSPYEFPTDEEADGLKLTPAQRIALEQILLGSQLAVANKAAGVTRMTLYRWFHRPNGTIFYDSVAGFAPPIKELPTENRENLPNPLDTHESSST